MSKLYKLKKWVSLSEAASLLADGIKERVEVSDVLQLALDGQVAISVLLINEAYARQCNPVALADVKFNEVIGLKGEKFHMPAEGRLFFQGEQAYLIEKKVQQLEEGLYDLPLCGGERIDVEHRFHQLQSGIERTAISLEHVFVRNQHGLLLEIQSHYPSEKLTPFDESYFSGENYHPAGALPEDSEFVLRSEAIDKFLACFEQADSRVEKPLLTRERNTLLLIIAGLCKEAKIDHSKPAKAAEYIKHQLDLMGCSVGETTIEEHLKKIPNALESRSK
ncbi:MAG: hypothetical protein EAZ37_04855 [Burkholderiales bacterium]|nr:MAG: hypothetical protein EAZ37_04855 [Burkholderiales bacterium]